MPGPAVSVSGDEIWSRCRVDVASIGTDLSNMGNEFYNPGEQRAAEVHRLFATIAPRYDLINDLQSFGMHRRWKRRLAQRVGVRPGEQALDLCCGTGDVSFALAACGAEVTGLDFSPEMLAIAERRRIGRESRHPSPRFIRGDAQQLPFDADTFDVITVGYGLRNLANWETGLGEMIRVAKPGARIAILDCGKPDNPLWRTLYFGYLRLVVPLFGLGFCGRASTYSYILESLKHYPAQRGIEAGMRKLGLVEVRIENILFGAMSINYGKKPWSQSAPPD